LAEAECAECGAPVRTGELGAEAIETPIAAALLTNSFDMPPMCVKCANYNLKAA
jgi:hypothetical protein